MKLNYLAVYDRKRDCGVYHKLMEQLQGFENFGIETKLVKVGQWVSQITVFGRKIDVVSYNWMNLQIDKNVDALYIRYQRCDLNFIRFLKRFKAERENRKIIIEIATYPYEQEDGAEAKYTRFKDKIFRPFLRYYVDRILTPTEHKTLFGINHMQLINGIDVAKVTPKSVVVKQDASMDMVAVASMRYWHGYERMIEGIKEYYQGGAKRAVKLHLVGNGPAVSQYKALVQKYGLEQYVIFYGQKEGTALEKIINGCDVGIGTLGAYHKIKVSSALKTREYAAKGLPIVNDVRIDVFPEKKYPFIFRVPMDESAIKVDEVLKWYDGLLAFYGSAEEMNRAIREAAYRRCDNKVAMRKICQYLCSNIE